VVRGPPRHLSPPPPGASSGWYDTVSQNAHSRLGAALRAGRVPSAHKQCGKMVRRSWMTGPSTPTGSGSSKSIARRAAAIAPCGTTARLHASLRTDASRPRQTLAGRGVAKTDLVAAVRTSLNYCTAAARTGERSKFESTPPKASHRPAAAGGAVVSRVPLVTQSPVKIATQLASEAVSGDKRVSIGGGQVQPRSLFAVPSSHEVRGRHRVSTKA
jgi:hypothetical protein